MRTSRIPLYLATVGVASAGLIPSFGNSGFGIADTSIPGNLPIWSFVLQTTTCVNATSPTSILAQLAPNTNGLYIHPPVWNQVNAAMLQDPQVNSIQQLQELTLTNVVGADWELCGIQISINNAQVYQDTNQVLVAANGTYTLSLADLQANTNWIKTTQVCNPPSQFSNYDISLLVIGKIGDYIVRNNNGIDWSQNVTDSVVTVSNLNGNTQVVNLMQFANGTDVTQFVETFAVIVNCGNSQLTIDITNFATTFDDPATVSEDTQSFVSNSIQTLASTQSVSASVCPTIAVTDDGSVTFAWPFGFGNLGAMLELSLESDITYRKLNTMISLRTT